MNSSFGLLLKLSFCYNQGTDRTTIRSVELAFRKVESTENAYTIILTKINGHEYTQQQANVK